MAAVQLKLFFDEKTETEELADELDELCDRVDNLRKGLFKRLSTLSSELRSAELRISLLEQQLYIAAQGQRVLEAKIEAMETLLNEFMEKDA